MLLESFLVCHPAALFTMKTLACRCCSNALQVSVSDCSDGTAGPCDPYEVAWFAAGFHTWMRSGTAHSYCSACLVQYPEWQGKARVKASASFRKFACCKKCMDLTKAIDHVPKLTVLSDTSCAALPMSPPSPDESRDQHSIASRFSLLEDRIDVLEHLIMTLSPDHGSLDHDTSSMGSLVMVDNASVMAVSD